MASKVPTPRRHCAAAIGGITCLVMAAGPAVAGDACPPREETFFSSLPADVIAQISGGTGASQFPPGAGTLSEPKVSNAGALFHKIRDTHGEAIGIASQMQRALVEDQGRPVQHTSWTVVIPTRGALFLQEVEDVTPVRQAVRRRKAGPSLPAVDVQTTIGPRSDGRGLIVGGSGEFERCMGTFVEVQNIQRVEPLNPVALGIVGGVELRIRFGS